MPFGSLSQKLGASKKKLDDKIDYTVGIMLNKYIGDKVDVGDTLFTMYVSNPDISFTDADFSFIEISSEDE